MITIRNNHSTVFAACEDHPDWSPRRGATRVGHQSVLIEVKGHINNQHDHRESVMDETQWAQHEIPVATTVVQTETETELADLVSDLDDDRAALSQLLRGMARRLSDWRRSSHRQFDALMVSWLKSEGKLAETQAERDRLQTRIDQADALIARCFQPLSTGETACVGETCRRTGWIPQRVVDALWQQIIEWRTAGGVSAGRAVLDLHQPCALGSSIVCGRCRYDTGEPERWPCPTVQAIAAALDQSAQRRTQG